jgi:nucleoside-triphosphatase THEP1
LTKKEGRWASIPLGYEYFADFFDQNLTTKAVIIIDHIGSSEPDYRFLHLAKKSVLLTEFVVLSTITRQANQPNIFIATLMRTNGWHPVKSIL